MASTMGALLTAARMHPQQNPELIGYALIVPVVLHAAYDFPLFAINAGIPPPWFGKRVAAATCGFHHAGNDMRKT